MRLNSSAAGSGRSMVRGHFAPRNLGSIQQGMVLVILTMLSAGCRDHQAGSNGAAAPAASGKQDNRVIDPPQVDDPEIDTEVSAAIQQRRDAVFAERSSPGRWGQLGMVMMAHDFNHQAAICFEEASSLDPQQGKWLYLQGKSVLRSNPRESIPLLEQAVKLVGNKPEAVCLTLVETLLELYELDEAEQYLLQFMAENSSSPRARFAQVRLSSLRGNYEQSLRQAKDLAKYLQTNPDFQGRLQPLLLIISESLRRLGDAEQAEAMRQQALAQNEPIWGDPYMAEVKGYETGLKTYLVRADLLFGNGEFDESIAILRSTLQKYPDSVWAKIYLGRALIRIGGADPKTAQSKAQLQEAVTVLEEALELDPNSIEAMYRLAVARTYLGENDEAVKLYRRAIELKPDFTMAYFNLANCLYGMGQREEAVAALTTAVETQPDFVDGHKQLGSLLLMLGRPEEAERHFNTAVQLRPNDAQLRQLLGRSRQAQR